MALWRGSGFQSGSQCQQPRGCLSSDLHTPVVLWGGVTCPGHQSLGGTALCPPVPAAVTLDGHGTVSWPCMTTFLFAPNWSILAIHCCPFPLFLLPSFKRGDISPEGFWEASRRRGHPSLGPHQKDGGYAGRLARGHSVSVSPTATRVRGHAVGWGNRGVHRAEGLGW